MSRSSQGRAPASSSSSSLAQTPLGITRWGTAGPTIVMIHGGVQGSPAPGHTHFSKQESLAANGWQVVVPDRPGQGRSLDPGRPDDAQADAVWAAGLLGDGAHLVGHSFGAFVALSAAARQPQSVRSLTLIEPGMQKLALDHPSVILFGLRVMAILALSSSPTARARRFDRLMRTPAEITQGLNPNERQRVGRAIPRLRVPSTASLKADLRQVKAHRLPLLVISGGWNAAYDITARRVADHGGGRVSIIRSHHHFPHLHSDEFNDLLVSFMTRAEGTGAALIGSSPSARSR